FWKQFGGKTRGFVPLHYMRGDFGLREFADRTAELLLFIGKGKVHARLSKPQRAGLPKFYINQGETLASRRSHRERSEESLWVFCMSRPPVELQRRVSAPGLSAGLQRGAFSVAHSAR